MGASHELRGRAPSQSAEHEPAHRAAPGKQTRTQKIVQRKASTAGATPATPATGEPKPEAPDGEAKWNEAFTFNDDAKGKPEEDFDPGTGTKNATLKGTYGEFEVQHGLESKPSSAGYGKYFLKIEMAPSEKVGSSKIGFMQVSRQGKPDGGYAKTKNDPYMTEDKAWRTESTSGWRVDRANAKRDQTPFYGMYKKEGVIKQYSTARVGAHGGDKAMMQDRPGVGDPDHMEFTATAMDMASGQEFGAVAWGFKYNSSKKIYTEETPSLVSAGSERMKGRDRAVEKWNKDVATEGSGIDKVPGA